MEIFWKVGMCYFVFIMKYYDGFCMFGMKEMDFNIIIGLFVNYFWVDVL